MPSQFAMTDIDEFMASPIVTWFVSCLSDGVKDQLTYEELIDGVLIYDVFLQMDIDGHSNDVLPSQNDPKQHLANLETVMRRIRHFYEDYHGEIILCEPDVRLIVQEPKSNVREVESLLVLLLGCAVKCRNNVRFVEGFTLFDDHTQTAIVAYIKKVLYFPDIVLSKEMLSFESTNTDDLLYHEQKIDKAFQEIYRINTERNDLLKQLQSATLIQNSAQACEKELQEWKSEAIMLNDQLDEYKCKVSAIESENKRLASEAKSNREALADMTEWIQQTEQLEQEVSYYKVKLKDVTTYKARIENLEKKNRSLRENKEEVENQLKDYKAESKRNIKKMEKEMRKILQQFNDLTIENEARCEQNSILREENADLEQRLKLSSSMNFTLDDSFNAEADDESFNAYNSSISEQLSQSAQSHVFKQELESRRLETLKENSILENSHQIDDLETEKKRLESVNEDLRLKVSQLQENLSVTNKEKMLLRVLLENDQKLGSEQMYSNIDALELQKESDEKIICTKELQMNLQGDEALNVSFLRRSPPEHEVEHDQLYNDYQSVLQEKNLLERQLNEAELKLTQHIEVNSDEKLYREHFYLKEDFILLMSAYYKEKSKLNELTKIHEECQKELHARNVKILELDVQNRKLRSRCEVLAELNSRMESDKKMLKSCMSQMIKENRTFVEKTQEKQQRFYEEGKRKDETVKNLIRTNERLEGKVMDHYRGMSNRCDSKKRSATVNAVKNTFNKVRRAGSELFSMSRSSSMDPTNFGLNKTLDNTSRASEFTYIGITRNNKSVDFLDNFSPDNFSFDKSAGS